MPSTDSKAAASDGIVTSTTPNPSIVDFAVGSGVHSLRKWKVRTGFAIGSCALVTE